MHVQFALLCEGSSDAPLVSVLRAMLIDAGAESAVGEAVPLTGTVKSKFQHLLRRSSTVDLVFVHRDADDQDPVPRYLEIADGATAGGWSGPLVCVVPIQTTEAWLLTSEKDIREVAGKRHGRAPLNLPEIGEIERVADPKGRLQEAYMAATETTGRRRRTAGQAFGQRRAALLERLDHNGHVRNLRSFSRLRDDIGLAVSALLTSPAEEGAIDGEADAGR